MAQAASATAIGAIGYMQLRWSSRRRVAFIITAAAAMWALPIGLVYGMSLIFF